MIYYSTNQQSPTVDFRQATLSGLAPDKGLYFPASIPKPGASFWDAFYNLSKEEIGYEVMKAYTGDSIPENELKRIVTETIAFDFPLKKIAGNVFVLELFHGPTLAFKDVGAGFMSRCLGYFAKSVQQQITVLVATSGDTGGAVAAGFAGVEGVSVKILFPAGKVSAVQELQLTTWGHNIEALEIAGNFDDCQRLVKQAFADAELQQKFYLTSANSINVARWLPQQLYYFFALQQWPFRNEPPVISVPSGNFGNICAGLLAAKSGLPVKHFIAACNTNDTVTQYLQTQSYQLQKARPTLSNAMDVGDPSNFVRILEIFDHQFNGLKNMMSSTSVSDEQTIQTIKDLHRQYGYMADPHGAVGYYALQQYLQQHPEQKGIFLETAHPVKFDNTMENILQQKLPLPAAVEKLYGLEKKKVNMPADYAAFKEHLLKD